MFAQISPTTPAITGIVLALITAVAAIAKKYLGRKPVPKPDAITRFVNSMVRLAEGAIKCGDYKYRTEDRLAENAKRKSSAQQRRSEEHKSELQAHRELVC